MALQSGTSCRPPKAYRVQIGGNCERCGDIEAACGGSGGQACKKFNRTFVVPQVEGQSGRYKLIFDAERDFPDDNAIPLGAVSLEVCLSNDQNPGHANNPDFDGKPRYAICVTLKFEGETPPVCWGKSGLKNCCNPEKLRRKTMNDKCCFPREIIVNGKPVPDYCPPQPHWQPGNPEDLNDAPFWPVLDVDLPEDAEFAPVRFSNGELLYRVRDIAADGFGVPWGHTRIYSNRLSNSYDLGNGTNWLVLQSPYLVREQSTKGECRIVLVRGTRNALWFTEKGGKWDAEFGAQHNLKYTPPEGDKDGYFQIETPNGHLWEFYDLHDMCERKQEHNKDPTKELAPGGSFKRHVGPGGQEIYTHYEKCRLNKVWRSKDNNVTKHTQAESQADEFFKYDYYKDGPNKDRLQYVLHKRMKKELTRAEFVYCEDDDKHGDHGDLKMAATQIKEQGDWKNLNVHYYRYHKEAKDTYCQGLLNLVLGPEAFRRICPESTGRSANRFIADASLSALAQFADDKEEIDLAEFADLRVNYHDSRCVRGIVMDGDGRRHSFEFAPKPGKDEFNVPKMRTTETRNDGATVVVNSNFIGQAITETLSGTGGRWTNHFKYDKKARLEKWHFPSSMEQGVSFSADAPKPRPHEGLVRRFFHDFRGYIQWEGVSRGGDGRVERLTEFDYGRRVKPRSDGTLGLTAVYFVSKIGTLGIGTAGEDDVLKLDYAWHGTAQIKTRRTLMLTDVPGERGSVSGDRSFTWEEFGEFGYPKTVEDILGAKTSLVFDGVVGSLKERTVTYDTWRFPQETANNSDRAHTLGTRSVTEKTEYTDLDDFGRPRKILHPWIVGVRGEDPLAEHASSARAFLEISYNDIEGRVTTAQGYDNTFVPPYQIEMYDRANRLVSSVAIARGSSVEMMLRQVNGTSFPALPPGFQTAGAPMSLPNAGAAGPCRRMEAVYDNQSRLVARRSYTNVSAGRFVETRFDYDPMYRRRTVTSPGGTMVRTLYDARGLPTNRLMGVSEGDLKVVESMEYDDVRSGRPGGGDGHLSRHTLHADPSRVTQFERDFRGRVLVERPGLGGKNVPTQTYSGHTRQGQWAKCEISPAGSGSRIRVVFVERHINARGYVYRTVTTQQRDKIEERIWTQNAGLAIQTATSDSDAFLRTLHDGRGRQVISYTGLVNGSGGATAPSIAKLDGIIVEGTANVIDALGNVSEAEHWVRVTAGRFSGLRRQTYIENRYDGIGRLRHTRQLKRTWAEPTRPSDEPTPSGWKIQPISATNYNARGEPHESYEFVSGNLFRRHHTTFDDLERPVRIVRNTNGGMPRIDVPDANVTTDLEYCPDGPVSVMRVTNHGQQQATRFNRGVTASSTASGNGVSSAVSCSYWLSSVVDPEGGKTTYGYNALGEVANYQDANGTVHKLAFDTLGRLVGDAATSRGSKAQVSFGYDFRGFMTLADYPGHATIAREHDLRGNVVMEKPAITGSSLAPTIEYEHIRGRLSRIRYPSAQYLYLSATARAVQENGNSLTTYIRDNARLNRTSELFWDGPSSSPLIKYDFVGLTGASPNACPIVLSGKETLKQTVEPFEAMDEFGRAFRTIWRTDLAHSFSFRSAFAQTGILTHRRSNAAQFDDSDFTHNALNFLIEEQPAPERTWKPDSVGNVREHREFLSDDVEEEIVTLHQKRTFNRKNQLTDLTTIRGPKWAKPVYDHVGNATAIPQPNDPTKLFHCQYDAWNRLIEVRDENRKIVAKYDYDALGRRVVKKRHQNGQLAETRFFYYSHDWRLLEEYHQAPPQPRPKLAVQYAWGLRGPDDLVHRRRFNVSPVEQLTPIQDELFNTKVLFDTSGNVKERYQYEPFGKPAIYADLGGDPLTGSQYDWNILYGGYYYDAETGLYHVRRRMLHPTLSTWLQPDPMGYTDGPNLYLYGRGSPVTFIDPSGEAVWLLAIPVLLYLGQALLRGAASATLETGIEYGVASTFGDESFSPGDAWLRNFAINSALALIPGGAETKVGLKAAQLAGRYGGMLGRFGFRVGTSTMADALWLSAIEGRSGNAMLGEALLGNVGGDLLGKAVGRGLSHLDVDHILRAGPKGGLRRNLLAWHRERFRLDSTRFYHGTSAHFASDIRTTGIDLSRARGDADFGHGFYMSTQRSTAMARAEQVYGDAVGVVVFRVPNRRLQRLSSLAFTSATRPWQDFVRFHKTFEPTVLMHGGAAYDLVSGPMLRRITSGGIALDWPTKTQTSIHTQRAVSLFNDYVL